MTEWIGDLRATTAATAIWIVIVSGGVTSRIFRGDNPPDGIVTGLRERAVGKRRLRQSSKFFIRVRCDMTCAILARQSAAFGIVCCFFKSAIREGCFRKAAHVVISELSAMAELIDGRALLAD